MTDDRSESEVDETQEKIAWKVCKILKSRGLNLVPSRVKHHNSHGLSISIDLIHMESEAEEWAIDAYTGRE
jgi:hypothetical protein